MKNKLLIFQIIAIVIEVALGTILHFTYEWSGQNQIIAIFSAVNESTWEHLKIAFFPMLFISIIGYFFIGKNTNNYIESKTFSILFAISFITIVYYSYTGIIGKNFAIINILIFILAIVIGELLAYRKMKKENNSSKESKILYVLVLVSLLIAFIQFAFVAPRLNIFQDPITGNYGVES